MAMACFKVTVQNKTTKNLSHDNGHSNRSHAEHSSDGALLPEQRADVETPVRDAIQGA
jgi:hypothetical protein